MSLEKEFKIISTIGTGAYGQILLVEDYKDSQTYVLKKLQIDVNQQAHVWN